MKIPFAIFRSRTTGAQRAGFALVVALTAIVLITVIVLAFFSKALLNRQISFTSTNQIKSDMLARTALDIVLGEVRQEIADYSTQPTNGFIYPLAPTNAMPTKSGVIGADTNIGRYTIAKVSAENTTLNPGPSGKIFGSSVKLNTKSRNGRTISQWYTTGPRLGTAELPSWSYLSRSGNLVTNTTGGASISTNTNYVTGRFAYTVYNVGGALNANVAGYPTNATNYAEGKSAPAYADLTTLGLTTANVTNLVSWRNAKTGTNTNIFNEWATGIPSGTNGTTLSPSAISAARSGHIDTVIGDNAFLSRRDLLRYLDAMSINTNAAGSLTHASVSSSAPTWKPSNVTGSSIAYGDDADKATSVNRNLGGVSAYNGTMRYYYDDGTFDEYDVTEKDPLLQFRFSLGKLAWLGHDGPNTAAFASGANPNQAILDTFGLTWNNSKKRWDYAHGDSDRILKLEEVRNQHRAPDFFELLKAGILEGSLGGQPGSNTPATDAATSGPAGIYFEYFSENTNLHILKIGANIIDQADRDNYPTAIHGSFVTGTGYQQEELFNTAFGLENLPMLQRVNSVSYKLTGDDVIGPEDTWIQPEVWNPNQSSTADPLLFPETPRHLRMVTYGGCAVTAVEDDSSTSPSHAKTKENIHTWVKNFGTDTDNPSLDGIVPFLNPKPGGEPSKPDFFSSPGEISQYYWDSSQMAYAASKNYLEFRNGNPPSGKRLIGAWLGSFDRDPRDWQVGGYPTHKISISPLDNPFPNEPHLTFVLQYNDKPDGTGSWRPYTMMARIGDIPSRKYNRNWRNGYINWFLNFNAARPDARTDRFSALAGEINSSGSTFNFQWSLGDTLRPTAVLTSLAGGGKGGVSYMMPDSGQGFTYRNPVTKSGVWTAYLLDNWAWNVPVIDSTPRFWYADPDGVVRPGDAWRTDYLKADVGDGVMLYRYDQLLASKERRRPVIMNRPFRSVGELGAVYRDQPFKTLDFWSEKSADSGLLDLFCISDASSDISAGRININASTPAAMQAMLSGGAKRLVNFFSAQADDATHALIRPGDEAPTIAQTIASEISASGPLMNPADMVERLSTPIYNGLSALTTNNTATSRPIDNKLYGEAPVRILANMTTMRSWDLLIDVVAQSGRLAATPSGLEDFIVEGERRYWLHVSIDRYTGKILNQQIEPFYE